MNARMPILSPFFPFHSLQGPVHEVALGHVQTFKVGLPTPISVVKTVCTPDFPRGQAELDDPSLRLSR